MSEPKGKMTTGQTMKGTASAAPYIPERMAHKLTFTGAVEAEYDGSANVSVEIPEGGGSVTPEDVAAAVESYMAENPAEETDPTVPAWAKAPEKPSYTAEEVGALPVGTEIPQQVQSDLSQNDSTAADYVKNRTHYEETVEEYVCFEAYMEYGTSQTASIDYEVPDGAECTVYFDGVVVGNNHAPVYGGGYVMVSSDMDVHFDNAAHTVQVGNYWNAGTVKVVVNKLFVVKQLDEKYIPDTIARAEDIPEIPAIPTTLPNPHKLTFRGAVAAEYDGSSAVEVVIPQGGGGGEASEVYRLVVDTTTTEDAAELIFTDDMDGNPLSLRKFIFCVGFAAATGSANSSIGISVYRFLSGTDLPQDSESWYASKKINMGTGASTWWGEIHMNVEAGKGYAIIYKRSVKSEYSNEALNSDGGTYHRLPIGRGKETYYLHETIDRINIGSGSATVMIPAGTTIKIWGVDA